MAYVHLVASLGTTLGTAAASVTIPVAAASTAGDMLILAVNSFGGSTGRTFSAVDTKGNTWTQRVLNDTSVTNYRVAILTSPGTSALTTSDTITLSMSAGTRASWCVAVHEFNDLSGFDTSAIGSGSGTAMSSGTTATATQNNELVFAAFGWSASSTFTAQSGFTAPAQIDDGNSSSLHTLGCEWQYVSASGTRSATATLSNATGWGGTIIALQQTSGSTPSTATRFWLDGSGNWIPMSNTYL